MWASKTLAKELSVENRQDFPLLLREEKDQEDGLNHETVCKDFLQKETEGRSWISNVQGQTSSEILNEPALDLLGFCSFCFFQWIHVDIKKIKGCCEDETSPKILEKLAGLGHLSLQVTYRVE